MSAPLTKQAHLGKFTVARVVLNKFHLFNKSRNFRENDCCGECFDANFMQQNSCARCFTKDLAF